MIEDEVGLGIGNWELGFGMESKVVVGRFEVVGCSLPPTQAQPQLSGGDSRSRLVVFK